MRRGAGLLVLLAGCYGYGNPYDASDERDELEWRTEESLNMRLVESPDYPQSREREFTEADLEGWRDTVLAAASDQTLGRLREESRAKISWLMSQCEDLMRQDEHNREPHFTVRARQMRMEQIRLKMIEDRISSGTPCRTE